MQRARLPNYRSRRAGQLVLKARNLVATILLENYFLPGNLEAQIAAFVELPLIEVYAPLHLADGKEVIAVAEVYNDGRRLVAAVGSIQVASASIIAAVTVPMMTILFLIVRRTTASVNEERLILTEKFRAAKTAARKTRSCESLRTIPGLS